MQVIETWLLRVSSGSKTIASRSPYRYQICMMLSLPKGGGGGEIIGIGCLSKLVFVSHVTLSVWGWGKESLFLHFGKATDYPVNIKRTVQS